MEAPQLMHCGGINTSSAALRTTRSECITDAADIEAPRAISPFDRDIVGIQSATDQPVKELRCQWAFGQSAAAFQNFLMRGSDRLLPLVFARRADGVLTSR
jgi:hypothetical protein